MKRFLMSMGILLAVGAGAWSLDLGALIDKAGLQPLHSGTKIINFTLDDLGGQPVSLSSYHGKVVVLNFWATWCGPCRSEMPSLETLYKKYRDQGLVVVGVNLEESRSAVRQFAKQDKITFPVLLDSSGRVALAYGARSLPVTYVIDRAGDVTSGVLGAHTWNSPETVALFKALLIE